MHCHNEFLTHQTAIFLVIYCILHHEEILMLLNKITGFEHIHGAQYILDRKMIIFTCVTWLVAQRPGHVARHAPIGCIC